jgi:hypothetical protein
VAPALPANMNNAVKAIGVNIPARIIDRADDVIE